jgi:ATP-binding cassette subfamily F protein 3
VFEVEGGKVHVYPGNYEDYLWRKEGGAAELAAASAAASSVEPPPVMNVPDAAATAANGKAKRVNPIKLKQMQDRLKFVEEEIPQVEMLIAESEQSLGVFVSAEETARVTSELDALREKHAALTSEWEELMALVS